MLNTPPLSLYIHLPWCVRKCPYCDFNSHRQPLNPGYSDYIDALLADLRFQLSSIQGRGIETIFIGGGTPSLFPASEIRRLLHEVSHLVGGINAVEVTLEANPGTLEAGRYAGYREAGINRLSIGVQSFNDRALQSLGRIHGSEEIYKAVSQAREAGFENINLDLMFGLPEQSVEEARIDVETAVNLNPEHISYYQLTIEPNTRFALSPPPLLPSDDHLWDIQLQGRARLVDAGYQQYEISAYSRVQKECRHNLNYWTFGDYLGIGAGAHSKLSDQTQQRIRRSSRVRSPEAYMAAAGTRGALSGEYFLKDTDLVIEFMMNLLRLNGGFTAQLFRDRTGLPLSRVEPILAEAQRRGLLSTDGMEFGATPWGHRYLNDLLTLFI